MHIGVDLDNTVLDATSRVDVLIDDGPHYAEEFALANKPVILYEQPYNSSVTNDLVLRAADWIEVKQHIDSLESKYAHTGQRR
ncbi:hypothetical protein ACFOLF_23395 [Paenibacillus sepulcri]|uniref:Uncharacterized protein n=1 Tax=Paenibacillus sepulcri TaxID=359917 RepID=A0ABS7C8E3_9BACL|nr:hypothetical protein [Paenibacillus sepulcri]